MKRSGIAALLVALSAAAAAAPAPGTDAHRKRFAKQVAKALSAADMGRYKPAPDEFALDGPDGQRLYLGNFYQEYASQQTREDQAAYLKFLPDRLSETEDQPETWEAASPDLMPRVKSRAYHENLTLGLVLQGHEDVPTMAQWELGAGLVIDLAIDRPSSMALVTRRDLREWKVAADTALETALQNLASYSHCGWTDLGPGLWLSECGDGYDTSRMLNPDAWSGLPLTGEPVFVPVAQDALLLGDRGSAEAMAALPGAVAGLVERPRWVSAMPVVPNGERFDPWAPADAGADWAELRVQTLGAWYGDQKALLDQLNEQKGADIFVSSFSAMRTETGAVRTYAVLAPVRQLLPKADLLAVILDAEQERKTLVDWDAAAGVLGDHLRETPLYPERWQVDAPLPPDALEALEALPDLLEPPDSGADE